MWTRDDQTPVGQGNNLYGAHPFALVVDPDGSAYGVFVLSATGIDVVYSPHPTLTIRTIGGMLDLYVVTGPTPADVTAQLTEVIGRCVGK